MKASILLLLNESKGRHLENINLMDEDNMVFMKKYDLHPFESGLIQDYSSEEREKARVFYNLAEQFTKEGESSDDESEEDSKTPETKPKKEEEAKDKVEEKKEEEKVAEEIKTEEKKLKEKEEVKAEEKKEELKTEEKKEEGKSEETKDESKSEETEEKKTDSKEAAAAPPPVEEPKNKLPPFVMGTRHAPSKHPKTLGEFSMSRDQRVKSQGEDIGISNSYHSLYAHSYDHQNWGAPDQHQAMQDILVEGHHLNKKGGRNCMPFDWVTVHWKSYLGDMNGELMEDSKHFKQGHPLVFQLGHFQSIKCWELAIVNMQAGETIDIQCPSYFANGGNELYSHFGSGTIPAHSDLYYELEVLECEQSINSINEKNQEAGNKAVLIEPEDEWDRKQKIIGSGKGHIPWEARANMKTDQFNRPVSDGCKHSVEKSLATKKELTEAAEDLEKLKAKVALQQKALKKRETEDQIDDEEAKAGKDVDTKSILQEQKDMMEELEILAQEKQAIKIAEKALIKAEKAHAKAKSDHKSNCEQQNSEITKVKAVVAHHETVDVPSPFANVQTLGSKGCFFIKSANKDGDKEFVLEASLSDKYAPKNTGVFNVDMQPFNIADLKKTQKWSYDATTHSLHSHQYPDKVMFESFNRNLIVFNYKPNMKNEAFSFDLEHQNWFNMHTNRVLQLSSNSTIGSGSEVLTDEFAASNVFQKWQIVDCADTVAKEEDAKEQAKEIKEEEKEAKEALNGEEVDDSEDAKAPKAKATEAAAPKETEAPAPKATAPEPEAEAPVAAPAATPAATPESAAQVMAQYFYNPNSENRQSLAQKKFKKIFAKFLQE